MNAMKVRANLLQLPAETLYWQIIDAIVHNQDWDVTIKNQK